MLSRGRFLKAPIVVVVFLATVAIIVGCSANGPPDSPTTARIGYLNITASLPLFVAEAKGFFLDEGVQIETQQMATSNQLVDGVAAGNLDAFVEASAVPVLAAEIQSPGRFAVFSVSAITTDAPFDAVLVLENSPLTSIDDLAGNAIGVFPGSTAANLLRKFLMDRGIVVSQTTFIPVPPQNHISALLAGSVDAVHAYEPTTAIALSLGGVRQLYGSVYAEMLDKNPQGLAAVATSFIQEHPDTAAKIIRAMERGMIFMREQEAATRQILGERMNLAPSVANRSVFLYMLPHNEIDVSTLQAYSDMLVELGELTTSLRVDSLLYRD